MVYVNESKYSDAVSYPVGFRNAGGSWNYSSNVSWTPDNKTQYGWRTGRDETIAAFNELPSSVKLGNKRKAEEALIRLAEMTSGGYSGKPDSPVHDRRYTAAKRGGGITRYQRLQRNTNTLVDFQGVFRFGSLIPPKFPLSKSSAEAEAAHMMRVMRPTAPYFDLTRFVGELGQVSMLFQPGNYVPKSSSDVGGSHLNVQFGILPTVSDVESAAQAILKGDDLVREFAEESAKRSHRTNLQVLDSINFESQIYPNGSSNLSVSGVSAAHNVVGSGLAPRLRVQGYHQHLLRTFSTFEWYVGDPDGFVTRMDSYKAAARKILGGGLTLSTAYELTPFSWMVDWYYDIGGLLAYQQDVADSNLVATRSGFVMETNTVANAEIGSNSNSQYSVSEPTRGNRITGSSVWQERYASSPYSIKPQWDMNPFRWGIVAALGLTKGPNIPFWKP